MTDKMKEALRNAREVKRDSDFSVTVAFTSCRIASVFEALLREAAQPCGCRIGTCESNADRRCRMADEIAEQQARTADEELRRDAYYLQDSRGYVGNDVLWWRKGGCGYTTDLREAEIYTREVALKMQKSRYTDIPWPKAYIDGKSRPAVDMQYIKREEAIAAEKREGS